MNKDDTDDILLANKIIRETHQDLCESAEECLEKTEKSLGKIRDESLKDGVNTSLFLLAIEQIEAALITLWWPTLLCVLTRTRRFATSS